ncbi:MAG: YIP1 family protein [Spirochaetes bacterium]|nr:YIP1 family protein [Spirochaetota bacterium]
MTIESFKSLRWTDYFLYTILDPRELYRMVKQKDPDPFVLSFTIPVAYSIFAILTMSLTGKESNFFYHKMSYGWILIFIYTLSKIIIYSSLIDITAQFFGYRGNIKEIITLYNFSLFPELFFLPVVYTFVTIDFAPSFFYILFSIVFLIWQVMILTQSFSEMHSIDFNKSLFILILPVVLIGLIFFMIAVLLIILAVGFIA